MNTNKTAVGRANNCWWQESHTVLCCAPRFCKCTAKVGLTGGEERIENLYIPEEERESEGIAVHMHKTMYETMYFVGIADSRLKQQHFEYTTNWFSKNNWNKWTEEIAHFNNISILATFLPPPCYVYQPPFAIPREVNWIPVNWHFHHLESNHKRL